MYRVEGGLWELRRGVLCCHVQLLGKGSNLNSYPYACIASAFTHFLPCILLKQCVSLCSPGWLWIQRFICFPRTEIKGMQQYTWPFVLLLFCLLHLLFLPFLSLPAPSMSSLGHRLVLHFIRLTDTSFPTPQLCWDRGLLVSTQWGDLLLTLHDTTKRELSLVSSTFHRS